ncbi:hypothetical protein TRVL_06573 [Trypanosoma vivax]|nr:hypothetical protein TRVL_06573 [Trypanosoma vivax]
MSPVRIVHDTTEIDRVQYLVVHCSDGKSAQVSKEDAAKLKFIERSGCDEVAKFEYPFSVLESLATWAFHYGMEGIAASPITKPCIYRTVQLALKDGWDKDFFSQLMDDRNVEHYLQTINAAEKFSMKGFHDFLCVCLSCKFRSEDDCELIYKIMGLEESIEVLPENLEDACRHYSWLSKAIEPIVRR